MKKPAQGGLGCCHSMDYIEFKLWILLGGMGVVFLAHFVYRLVTGRSLEELARRDRQEPPQG